MSTPCGFIPFGDELEPPAELVTRNLKRRVSELREVLSIETCATTRFDDDAHRKLDAISEQLSAAERDLEGHLVALERELMMFSALKACSGE